MKQISIIPFFEERKIKLKEKLSSVSGEKIEEKSQKIVLDFLDELFGLQGIIRQKLPDSERYLIESVMLFSKAQTDLILNFFVKELKDSMSSIQKAKSTSNDFISQILNDCIIALAVSVFLPGGILMKAAISGGVVVAKNTGQKVFKKITSQDNTQKLEAPIEDSLPIIDINSIINAIEGICRGFDDILKTYRVQVKNANPILEPKHFESENSLLLDQIQAILGASYYIDSENSDDVDDLIDECLQLEKLLSNKGLKVLRAEQGTSQSYFDIHESKDAIELPAILRGNKLYYVDVLENCKY